LAFALWLLFLFVFLLVVNLWGCVSFKHSQTLSEVSHIEDVFVVGRSLGSDLGAGLSKFLSFMEGDRVVTGVVPRRQTLSDLGSQA
jgi:hypothetical protein